MSVGTGPYLSPVRLAVRSYEAQVRAGYLAKPIAQRAVRLVAECVAWAPVGSPTAPARWCGR